MTYKKYEKYKDSYEEWIGIVPETWQVEPIREFYDYRSEKVSDKAYEPLSVTKQGILPQLEHAAKTDNNDNRKKVKKGDFVINSRSDRKGSCGVSPYEGSVSLIYHVLSSKDSSINAYAHHLFRSPMFAEEFYKWGHGIVDDLWSTRWDEMKKIKIPIPPKEERAKIGIFLDKRTKHINEQISSNKKLVELLEEKIITLINQVIHKGLDSNVAMKDSGVKWIGKIPAHWEIKRLKYNCEVNPSNKKSIEDDNLKVNFLPMEKVSEDGWYDKNSIAPYFSVSKGYTYFEDNDVLVAKITPCFENGKSAVVKDLEYGFGFGSTEFHILRFKEHILPEFIYYLIKTYAFRTIGQAFMTGTAGQKRIGTEFIENYMMVTPPISEQENIVAYLDKEINKLTKTINEIKENIKFLEEYKNSLIHNVVTGKIDVREEVV